MLWFRLGFSVLRISVFWVFWRLSISVLRRLSNDLVKVQRRFLGMEKGFCGVFGEALRLAGTGGWWRRFYAGISCFLSNFQKFFHYGEKPSLVLREAKGVVELAV